MLCRYKNRYHGNPLTNTAAHINLRWQITDLFIHLKNKTLAVANIQPTSSDMQIDSNQATSSVLQEILRR
jgi:hypothetical protein